MNPKKRLSLKISCIVLALAAGPSCIEGRPDLSTNRGKAEFEKRIKEFDASIAEIDNHLERIKKDNTGNKKLTELFDTTTDGIKDFLQNYDLLKKTIRTATAQRKDFAAQNGYEDFFASISISPKLLCSAGASVLGAVLGHVIYQKVVRKRILSKKELRKKRPPFKDLATNLICVAAVGAACGAGTALLFPQSPESKSPAKDVPPSGKNAIREQLNEFDENIKQEEETLKRHAGALSESDVATLRNYAAYAEQKLRYEVERDLFLGENSPSVKDWKDSPKGIIEAYQGAFSWEGLKYFWNNLGEIIFSLRP